MNKKIIEICLKEGFSDAAIVDTNAILFDAAFRQYCEENLCGHYGANYSCPPDCGTSEEMKQMVIKHKYALVLRTVWNIDDFKNDSLIKSAKRRHNDYTMRVIKLLEKQGHTGFMVGASGCTLCTSCLIKEGKPCPFPDRRYSCMSAYCIYVKDLAEKCGMVYDYKQGKLPLFSMYVYG